MIGRSEKWFSLAIGPWKIHLALDAAKSFPDMDRHIPRPADAVAQCQLSADDAQFLAKALPRLPGDDEYNFPVTLDLNGRVAIHGGYAACTQHVDELACRQGEENCIGATNSSSQTVSGIAQASALRKWQSLAAIGTRL